MPFQCSLIQRYILSNGILWRHCFCRWCHFNIFYYISQIWFGEISPSRITCFHKPHSSENKSWEWNILPLLRWVFSIFIVVQRLATPGVKLVARIHKVPHTFRWYLSSFSRILIWTTCNWDYLRIQDKKHEIFWVISQVMNLKIELWRYLA